MIGDLSVDVVEPMNVRKFSAKDWYMSECEQIENAILTSGNGWVSFMHSLVSHIMLNGEDIQSYLGISSFGKGPGSSDDEDEDFSE